VALPDHPRLLKELRLLERSVHRSGRDNIDHGAHGTDDHANAVCGVLQNLASYLGSGYSDFKWVDGNDDPDGARAFRMQRFMQHIARYG
jgi:hypothetical protein